MARAAAPAYDATAPAVTIYQAAGQSDPATTAPNNFTAVFDEPVMGFDGTDVSLSGAAGATTVTVTKLTPNDGTTARARSPQASQ